MDEHLRHQRDTSLGQLDALIRARTSNQEARGRSMRPARGSRSARPRSISCPAAAKPTGWPAPTAGPFSCARPTAAWWWRRTRPRSSTGFSRCWRRARRRCRAWTTSRPPRPARRRGRGGSTSCTTRRCGPSSSRRSTTAAHALERGEYGLALILSCGVIEALITDALQSHSGSGFRDSESIDRACPSRSASRAAERAALIRSGCARLPPVARNYRDLTDADGELRSGRTVSEREARVTTQVLHVVMRDLDPGR